MRATRWLTAAAISLGVLAGSVASGQSRATTADLTGVVVDQGGGVLIGATVTATSIETNAARAAQTTGAGRFVLPALPPGRYSVRVDQGGFTPQVIEEVILPLGGTLDLAITLEIAGIEQRVTVVPSVRTVDVERASVSSVVTQRQIESLPIEERNYISLSLLTPGAAPAQIPQQGVSQSTGLTFAGQNARANNITIDGLDNNDLIIGGVREALSQSAVQEFQVLASSYSAEFGKSSGGVVNVVTRSGGNTPTGDAYFFFRDDALNAKDYFERVDVTGAPIDQGKAPYARKQFGGTYGGPIRRDRLFFFGSVERLDLAGSNFVTIDDRTQVVDPFLGIPLGTAVDILRNAGFPVDTGHVPFDVRSTQLFAKLTYPFQAQERLDLRFSLADRLDENVEPFGGIVARSRAGSSDSISVSGGGSLTSILSQTALNEARVQVVNYDVHLNALDPHCGGPCLREDQGGPNLEVTGVASVGRERTTPLIRDTFRWQFVDTFTAYRNAHELKAGVDLSVVDFSNYSVPLYFGGRYIFAPLSAIPGLLSRPISPIQAVALGFPAAYVQGYGNSTDSFSYKDLSLFVQDNWRLSDRLSLRAGLRYQRQFWGQDQYVVPGYPGSYPFPEDHNDLAPRVSVSWQPENRETSVHAAYGMFYASDIAAIRGVPSILDGGAGVRILALRLPRSVEAWNAPGHQLPQSAVEPFPSVQITVDPALKTPYAHHASVGVTRELPANATLAVDALFVRGFNQLGTVDFNPLVPSLGAGRRLLDVNGQPGTSASVLQYTSFGRTWYKGLTVSLNKRFNGAFQLQAGYTLSKAEDTATDFQTAFIVQDSGRGRDPANPDGLPIGFDPLSERGAATHDQRHRFVASGTYLLPAEFQVSGIATIGSGWAYNILAGADLNRDGDGGAFPSDRPRTNPADPATSLARNSGRLPTQATVDARVSRAFALGETTALDLIFEVFNLFDRVNFVQANNIFGSGAYPASPLPAFGRFEKAAAPRQVQLAARLRF